MTSVFAQRYFHCFCWVGLIEFSILSSALFKHLDLCPMASLDLLPILYSRSSLQNSISFRATSCQKSPRMASAHSELSLVTFLSLHQPPHSPGLRANLCQGGLKLAFTCHLPPQPRPGLCISKKSWSHTSIGSSLLNARFKKTQGQYLPSHDPTSKKHRVNVGSKVKIFFSITEVFSGPFSQRRKRKKKGIEQDGSSPDQRA